MFQTAAQPKGLLVSVALLAFRQNSSADHPPPCGGLQTRSVRSARSHAVSSCYIKLLQSRNEWSKGLQVLELGPSCTAADPARQVPKAAMSEQHGQHAQHGARVSSVMQQRYKDLHSVYSDGVAPAHTGRAAAVAPPQVPTGLLHSDSLDDSQWQETPGANASSSTWLQHQNSNLGHPGADANVQPQTPSSRQVFPQRRGVRPSAPRGSQNQQAQNWDQLWHPAAELPMLPSHLHLPDALDAQLSALRDTQDLFHGPAHVQQRGSGHAAHQQQHLDLFCDQQQLDEYFQRHAMHDTSAGPVTWTAPRQHHTQAAYPGGALWKQPDSLTAGHSASAHQTQGEKAKHVKPQQQQNQQLGKGEQDRKKQRVLHTEEHAAVAAHLAPVRTRPATDDSDGLIPCASLALAGALAEGFLCCCLCCA